MDVTEKTERASKSKKEQVLDPQLITMLKSLKIGDENSGFSHDLIVTCERMSYDIRLCRYLLESNDMSGLEATAQQLAQNSLLIGAANSLKLAIELQSLCRMKDYGEISKILEAIEAELQSVKLQLIAQG